MRSTLTSLLVLGSAPLASAALLNVSDLYNTGVDNSRVPLPDNAADPHYAFAVPPPSGTAPVAATSAGGFPIGPWMGDNTRSAWISPSADTNAAMGDYVYRTTFTLPAGIDLSQVFVAGRWTSDNNGLDIRINGQSTGITNGGDFTNFSPRWAIQRGFLTGVNTLDFVVNEASGGPSGLRVEMEGRYAAAGRVAIPGLKNSGSASPEGPTLADNAVDPGLTLGPGSAMTGPVLVATSAGGFPIGPWLGDSIYSGWVTPTASTEAPEGNYFYQLTFDLSGLQPSTAEIYGRWAVDNGGADILLNGASTGNVNTAGFADWTDFSLTGGGFLPGLNTLTFHVTNAAPSNNPTGLRFEFLSATAVPIPEPGAASLLLLGAAAALRRRRA